MHPDIENENPLGRQCFSHCFYSGHLLLSHMQESPCLKIPHSLLSITTEFPSRMPMSSRLLAVIHSHAGSTSLLDFSVMFI